MIDLDALEKLARAATPGPWATDDPWIVYSKVGEEIIYLAKTAGLDTTRTQYPKDADYIAAASPSVILDLIGLARAAADSLPKIKEGERVASFAGDERFNELLGAVTTAEFSALNRNGADGTGRAAIDATKALIAYLDSQRVASGFQSAAPVGWNVQRHGSEMIVQKRDVGGYLAEPDSDNIASSILFHFATDVLAGAAPVEAASPWIKNTGVRPVAKDVRVAVIHVDGDFGCDPADNFDWGIEDDGSDIAAYFVIPAAPAPEATPESDGCAECKHTYMLTNEKCRHCGYVAGSQGWQGGRAPGEAQ